MTVGLVHFSGDTVLITGVSSGIGKATARFFFERGWNVVATLRDPKGETEFTQGEYLQSKRFLLLTLDVCDAAAIGTVFQKAIAHFGKIDVVVNNAGYALTGIFEAFTQTQILQQFQTNVFGLMGVCQKALLHFRETKKDKDSVLINVSSMAGRVCMPLYSVYHASKWAVEGFTESLQFECAGLKTPKIRVKLIEPGVVKTDFYLRSSVKPLPDQVPEAYRSYAHHVRGVMDSKTKYGISPEAVAKTIYRAATDGSSQLRYAVGMDAVLLLFIRRFLPDWLYRAMIHFVDFLG